MSEQLINLKLISEVEKHSCLYNNSFSEYYRKDRTEKAWNEVAAAVNLTESQCREKWKNIRAVFCRHMKPSTKKKKPYYLADAMRFTLPFIRALNPNVDQNEASTSEFNDDDDLQACPQRSPSPPTSYQSAASPQTSSPPSPQPASELPELSQISPQPTAVPQSSVKRIHRTSGNITDPDSITKRTKLDTSSRDYDMELEYKRMFLLSLLPDLGEMSAPQMRKFRRGIACLIDDILSETSSTSAQSSAQNPVNVSSPYYKVSKFEQNEERSD